LRHAVKTPRRIRSVVIFPNQRSTRFSHDEDPRDAYCKALRETLH
jgi:hypothetical protein